MAKDEQEVLPGKGRDKSVPWYHHELINLSEPARKLLEDYAGVAPENVNQHVYDVREKAWEICSYPCVGMFGFAELAMLGSPCYAEVLERVKNGQKLLDLGCCFGQELRNLVHNGAPSENLYGSDLRMDFMSLGYDLYLDKAKLKSEFIAANALEADNPLLQFQGYFDIIHAGSFFHLFTWEQQLRVATLVIKLLKPQKDSLLLGHIIGNKNDGPVPCITTDGSAYRHNEESWRRLWKEAGEATGTRWKAEAKMGGAWSDSSEMNKTEESEQWLRGAGIQKIRFSVRRE